jgi:hypothetical protein
MNSIIKKQLEKVTATNIEFDDNTVSIYIPKTTSYNLTSLKKDSCYLIELDDSLLNPSSNSTLASNWNAGRIPEYKYYNAEINSILNKMVQVTAVPVINGEAIYNKQFYGWLPFDQIKIIKQL